MMMLARVLNRLAQLILGRPDPEQEELEPDCPLELPWKMVWDRTASRSAGRDFSRAEYRAARRRAEAVARATLGEEIWTQLTHQGYIEVRSRSVEGRVYRLRAGRRIEVCNPRGGHSGEMRPYLCVNPRYPLPELEFLAQLYLYLRDREQDVLAVAIPQPYDAGIARTF
jgi:hypothetical protein